LKAIDKYLAQWAEPEARACVLTQAFDHVVVIPCCNEDLTALTPITQARAQGALVIVVINAAAHAPAHVHAKNAALAEALADREGVIVLTRIADEGVGLARKIGCDVALALWRRGLVRSRFIHTTDADVELPPDYFARTADTKAALALYPFFHRLAPGFEEAMQLYEISLHYYVRGLAWAGSAWAFHTLGSCIAVDAETYATVRGFPRRDAAEDFYFIAKIAKIARVEQLRGRPLSLAGRPSDRVPFGTGAAVRKLTPNDFCLYAPEVFTQLRAHENKLTHFIECGDWLGSHAPRAGRDAAERRGRARESFDAFHTLKRIHAAREAHPSLPWREALAAAPFMPAWTGDLESYRTLFL
jgi:hypothetical protein